MQGEIVKDSLPAVVQIDYVNHRGERAWRTVLPESIRWDATEWHPEKQWLLWAWDFDRQAVRAFALKDVHGWRPLPLQEHVVAKLAANPGSIDVLKHRLESDDVIS